MNWAAIWPELRPILGPLIQAAVVLIVGAFTVAFQLRQARTAERKLFTDIHDKRHKALTSFAENLTTNVVTILYEDDAEHRPLTPDELLDRRIQLERQLRELSWLFADDVMFEASRAYKHGDTVMSLINRFRNHLASDDHNSMSDGINDSHIKMHEALNQMMIAARHYLYVGHIKTPAPAPIIFTTDELLRGRPNERGR